MLHAKQEAVRVAAIHIILDRAYGKAKQPIEHTGDIGIEVADMSNAREILADRIARAIARDPANDNPIEPDGRAGSGDPVGLEGLGEAIAARA
jgi:hypothetical protein